MEGSLEASCTDGWPGAEFWVSSMLKSAIVVKALMEEDSLESKNVCMY